MPHSGKSRAEKDSNFTISQRIQQTTNPTTIAMAIFSTFSFFFYALLLCVVRLLAYNLLCLELDNNGGVKYDQQGDWDIKKYNFYS